MSSRLIAPQIARLSDFLAAGLLSSCLIATPCAALEFDLTEDSTQYLSDPSFIPREGQIYSVSSYAREHFDEYFQPPYNIRYLANENVYSQSFSYGITDRLSFAGAASFTTLNGKDIYQFVNFSSAVSRKAFTNPIFSVTYRAIDQTDDSPVSFDIKASYAPPAVDTSPQTGGFSFYVGREMKSLTIQAEGGVTYYEPYQPQGPSSETINSNLYYFFGLRSEWRLLDRFSIDSGVVYSKQSRTIVTFGGFVSHVGTFDGSITPYVAFAYDIWPSHVNIAFEYDHDFIGDEHESAYVPGDWVNQNEDVYAVHLRLLF